MSSAVAAGLGVGLVVLGAVASQIAVLPSQPSTGFRTDDYPPVPLIQFVGLQPPASSLVRLSSAAAAYQVPEGHILVITDWSSEVPGIVTDLPVGDLEVSVTALSRIRIGDTAGSTNEIVWSGTAATVSSDLVGRFGGTGGGSLSQSLASGVPVPPLKFVKLEVTAPGTMYAVGYLEAE